MQLSFVAHGRPAGNFLPQYEPVHCLLTQLFPSEFPLHLLPSGTFELHFPRQPKVIDPSHQPLLQLAFVEHLYPSDILTPQNEHVHCLLTQLLESLPSRQA